MTNQERQDLYIAVIVYESRTPSSKEQPLYQESFVLIWASDEDDARQKSHDHAQEFCISYENSEGETVAWSLKHVVDVNQVLDDELGHGAELYARHFRDYDSYHRFEPLLGGSVD